MDFQFYFAPDGAPWYPGWHYLGSRNWQRGEKLAEPPYGERWAARQTWTNGAWPVPAPPAVLVGPAGCLGSVMGRSRNGTPAHLIAGVDPLCYPDGFPLTSGGLDLSGHLVAAYTLGDTQIGLCKNAIFDVQWKPIFTSVGGLDLSGDASWLQAEQFQSLGGLDLSGDASWLQAEQFQSLGGLDLSGTAAWKQAEKFASSGGLDLSGSDTLVFTAGGFSPASIPGLLFWLDAEKKVYQDAGTTPCDVGSYVQQWNDQSGHGWNATQAVSANRPTYQLWAGGPKHAVNFNGSSQFLRADGITASVGAYTLAVVFNNAATAANVQMLFDSQNGRLAFCSPTTAGGGPGWYDGAWKPCGTVAYGAQRCVFLFVGSGGTGGVRRAGAIVGNASCTGTPPLAMTNTVGCSYLANSGWLYGEVAELCLYTGALSGTNLTNLETYLKNKWGVP